MYLTHEGMNHEFHVALGNPVATGSTSSTEPTHSFPRPSQSNGLGVGANRDSAVVLQVVVGVELRKNAPPRLGGLQVEC